MDPNVTNTRPDTMSVLLPRKPSFPNNLGVIFITTCEVYLKMSIVKLVPFKD